MKCNSTVTLNSFPLLQDCRVSVAGLNYIHYGPSDNASDTKENDEPDCTVKLGAVQRNETINLQSKD
jgi:hypothetical protein